MTAKQLVIVDVTDATLKLRLECQKGHAVKILQLVVFAVALSTVVSAQQASYVPPRLVSGGLPGLPPPMVVGGGEVLIEATVDQSGALTHSIVLRTTPPYTQMALDAVARWRFTPARTTIDGKDTAVDGTVLIAAVYRPPTLMNGPTIGDRPQDLAEASSKVPYPVSTVAPSYPPQARSGSVVLYEVALDEIGQVKNIRAIGADAGFDATAKDALIQWKFRGASLRGLLIPSMAYVIFGFQEPIVIVPSRP
jgi:hypothetical protein